MKIAYVTTYDARDPGIWAGTGHHIAKALEKQSVQIDYVGPLRESRRIYNKVLQTVYARLFHQAIHRDREVPVLDGYARQVEAALARSDAQIVVSPGSVPVAKLKTRLPIVIWTDATYGGIVDFYKWELPASKRSRRLGNSMEHEALSRCHLAIFSSDWAARTAQEMYGIPDSKIKVVPFGANIADEPGEADVNAMIARRPRDRCNLLFVGIGWQRKGGDVAVEVARLLNERGLSTQLTLLGSDAPQDLPGFVNRLGFIDKKTPQGREQFNEVFGSSHFLLLPARAEAFGVVLCEAGSFGVPCIATRTGGIPTIVRNGENGMLFATDDPSRMADSIQNLFRDSRRYDAMAQSSFAEYRARLNWNVAGRTVKELLTSL